MNKHRDFLIKFNKFLTKEELTSVISLLDKVCENEIKRAEVVNKILWAEKDIEEIDRDLMAEGKILSDVFKVDITLKEVDRIE